MDTRMTNNILRTLCTFVRETRFLTMIIIMCLNDPYDCRWLSEKRYKIWLQSPLNPMLCSFMRSVMMFSQIKWRNSFCIKLAASTPCLKLNKHNLPKVNLHKVKAVAKVQRHNIHSSTDTRGCASSENSPLMRRNFISRWFIAFRICWRWQLLFKTE